MAKIAKSYVMTPQGHGMSVSEKNPLMNLQSKFCYSIITQTLNIALCKRDQITDRLDAPADLPGWGHKNVIVAKYFGYGNKFIN